ncbi:hypothetical protein BCON_0029g00300 [Botryotinia convoluta]|uniref:Uncharacterized protein n=1 Tax=Botryotinia convoluta TaxID=54673 RepID=A0A4Z1IHP7_9HELO|nr:hypothetical protein BCON_0029g00300 [Botryotinia convoluta]
MHDEFICQPINTTRESNFLSENMPKIINRTLPVKKLLSAMIDLSTIPKNNYRIGERKVSDTGGGWGIALRQA